jgi:hypothetical protein
LNAHAESWVRSVKEECLSKIIPFGERFLRQAMKDYVVHYHTERNHQGREQRAAYSLGLQKQTARIRSDVANGWAGYCETIIERHREFHVKSQWRSSWPFNAMTRCYPTNFTDPRRP